MTQAGVNYSNCVKIYNAMLETATELPPVPDDTAAGGMTLPDGRRWIGSTTKLFELTGVPISTYARVMSRLRSNGCIEQLRRGGRDQPSIFMLWKSPEEADDLKNFSGTLLTTDAVHANLFDTRLKALEKNLQGINIAKTFAELAQQMQIIRDELNDHKESTEKD